LGQSITAGVLVAFVLYIERFFDPIRDLSRRYDMLQSTMAGGERILTLMDTEAEVKDADDAREMETITGAVRFEHVSFHYSDDSTLVLDDIDFDIRPGETVAFVGETGAGKTTIVKLLSRFHDPTEGRICVDGHDLRTLTQASLRRQMGIVLQDPFLFNGTVKENILFGRLDATDAEVINAAEAVGAHEFIMALPLGYETEMGERGGNLSLGQRQLISFARALVADAKILVLDEATANIDSYTEMLIQRALVTLLKGRTGLVIAHRLATIRGADRIIVLQNGQVAEQGNHDQLMRNDGLYSKLYNLNYSSFDDIPDEELEAASAPQSTT